MSLMQALSGALLLGVLLFIHSLREASHTSGRLYLKELLDGIADPAVKDAARTNMDARTMQTLRLARVMALTLWVIFLVNALRTLHPALRWVGALGLTLLADEGARMVGQWISLRSAATRRWLVRAAQRLVQGMSPLSWIFWWTGQHLFGLEPTRDVMLALDEDQILIIAHREAFSAARTTERELITNIFDFRETVVREIMVPRLDIVAVPVTASLREALDIIVNHGHSRLPVYEGTIDRIVGVLYAKDVLRWLRETYPSWPETTVAEVMRPPYFVPDSKRVSELLPEMRQRKVHLAIVVDEYGGTAGIVTIEDILEEIVGEIQDEFDREMPDMVRVGENEYVINARADLEDVSDFIGVPLPDEYADTLGGFIYTLLNRMPERGDVVIYPPVRMQVLTVDGRRIRAVRITVDPTLERKDGQEAQVKERSG